MRTRRLRMLIMVSVSVLITLGAPLLRSYAQNDEPDAAKPGGVSPEEILNQRRQQLHALEKSVKDLRDEIVRQHDTRGFDPTDVAIADAGDRATLQNATLTREVAEIDAREYTDGYFLQESEIAKAEIGLAEDNLTRAKKRAASLKDAAHQLDVERAEDALDEAKAKLDRLQQHDKPKRLAELESVIEKAKANERALQAQSKLRRARVARKQAHIKAFRTSVSEDRVVLLWDDAIARQKRAGTLLGEAEKLEANGGAADQVVAKRAEAKKLAAETQALLVDAASVNRRVTDDWTKLRDTEAALKEARESFVRALKLSMPKEQGQEPPNAGDQPLDVLLKQRRDRVRELAAKLTAALAEMKRQHADVMIPARSAAEAAESAQRNATSDRQRAELAVKEYTDVIFPQELEWAEADIKQAAKELETATENARKSNLVTDQLQLQKSRLVLDQVRTKLEVLNKYTKRKTTAELQSATQRALSDEFAKRATADLEKLKVRKTQALINRYQESGQDELVLALLSNAIDASRRVATLLGETQELANTSAPDSKGFSETASKVGAKRSEARKPTAESTATLTEAVYLAKHVSAEWAKVLELDEELRKARESVANLEKLKAKN